MPGYQPPTFVADCSLGQLAKQLRLAGFDTLMDHHVPDSRRLASLAGAKRIVLTRSTKVQNRYTAGSLLFIHHDRPLMQVRQVMSELHLQRGDVHPFSRCSNCNQVLQPISNDQVFGRVPEYVRQQHAAFKTCPQCHRIYWPGSHTLRWLERMCTWFE